MAVLPGPAVGRYRIVSALAKASPPPFATAQRANSGEAAP